ncbi:hypothetical protein WME75_16560 [Sorangium sp. So ce1014]|uniref:hypothetical protein n=1 Tax=Sorangium sp. So ce1014 TaxID=3133326 RepID=UPI003F61336B
MLKPPTSSMYNAHERRRKERTPHRNSRDVGSSREQRYISNKTPFEQQSVRRKNAQSDTHPAYQNKHDLGDAVHGYQTRSLSCLPADRSSVGDACTDHPVLSHRASEQTDHQHLPPETHNTYITGKHGSSYFTVKSPYFSILSLDQNMPPYDKSVLGITRKHRFNCFING